MRKLIHNTIEKCVGCNRCTRVCPIGEANVTHEVGGRIVVEIARRSATTARASTRTTRSAFLETCAAGSG